MSAHPASGIIFQQRPYQHIQRMSLPYRHRILRPPTAIQPTFITDADTFLIESLYMRPDLLQRTGSFYIPILTDIEMITGTPLNPLRRWHTSRSCSVKSRSSRVAEQCTTIRSISLIVFPFPTGSAPQKHQHRNHPL